MWCHFWPLSSWLLLLCYHTTIGYCTLLYDDLRLAAFTVPDFRTSFILRSNNGSDSFREIRTGHDQMPFHVRVYAKVLNGTNAGFCFEGVGSAQVSARKTSYPSGGIVFAYDESRVRIWAPSQFKGKGTNGSIVSVQHGWGNERHSQTCDEALIVVEVWYIGPSPTFQTNVPVDTQSPGHVFVRIDHQLGQIPERVLVRVTPDPKQDSPNKGFWFNAITASQNSEKKGYGGVIFAYDEEKILLWAPSTTTKKTGCIFVQNGWGNELYTENTPKCTVHIFAWVLKFPVPAFKTEWKFMISQGLSDQTFLEINHLMNTMPALVIVQGRIGNKGLIFEATGAAMSTDTNTRRYGGILFAYDKNRVRIWLPKQHKGHRSGYSILVKSGWGDDQMLLETHNIRLRVIIYTSNCDPQSEMVTEKGICKSIQYNSYQWTAGRWGKCSSICNKGVNHRDILACSVSSKETVLDCGFGENMCNWQSVPSSSWARVKDTVASSRHNYGWNLPSDFYHAAAVSNGSGNPVRLVSPKFPAQHSCTLTFAYKMLGIPPAILAVLVSEEGGEPKNSGWIMRDDQGGQYWRQGYVKLSNFPKLTQIIFGFTIARKPEPNFPISYGNVSIDDVRLVCERIERKSVDTGVCRQRKIPSAGCIHPATQPTVKGPAYALVRVMDNKDEYVVAKGIQGDLIASYEFRIHVGGEYSIWLLAFGTSTMDNGVTFRIDDLDNYFWQTTFIEKGRPIWTQYMYETFTLKPGVHTVHLLQYENKFRYSHLVLTPKELLTWVPLGMQSRYIPDSALDAYPPSSLPDPKFGRLNEYDAWCSSDHNPGYVRLEITLPQLALISRISVQGGHQIKRKTNSYWVSVFAIKVSVDGQHFSWYRISTGKKMFSGNSDSNGIVEQELPFAVLAKKIQIFPHDWENWICMRVELYGVYMTDNMCAAAGQETPTTKECQGDRNCSLNADCKPMTNDSIIKTGLHDSLKSREACHCHNGYHGDSCEYIGCDPNPCQHEGECQEGEANFTCVCPMGYHGSLCQWPCPVGKYGKDCAHTCLCSRHGSCNIATGHCSCEVGYYGMQCEYECPRGYFGVDCKQTCQCRNSGDCDHVTGACNCTAGWTGPFCDVRCSNNTWGYLCQNECLCSDQALSCNPVNGECICEPGFSGKTCSESCPPGRYGLNCSGICQCSEFGRCHQTDGSCTCVTPGYTGTLCDQPCSRGFHGVGCKKTCVCAPNAECSSNSGVCICGNGFSGPKCPVPCQADRWGPDCKYSCECEKNATCLSDSGECKCLPGWRGPHCSSKCPKGAWDTPCDKTCSCSDRGSCNPQSGKCECDRGWTGTACNVSCPSGWYGNGCRYRCTCVNGVECAPDTGKCICPAGWVGYTCAQACPSGYYGENCASKCSCENGASCDHVLGTCSCPAGWTGANCSRKCPEGFFGLGCSSPCQCRHGNGKSCDAVTGKCQCGPGYLGPSCSRTCEPGFYGQDCSEKCRCLNGAECRPTDGRCHCLAGFFGDVCERQCPTMTYGVNCTQRCDSCTEGQVSSCDHVTGKCLCLPGYYGYHCENECQEGQYGEECALKCDCANGASCDHVDGTCECPEGFTGEKCERPCPEGRFGYNCQGVCLCENGARCDKVKGNCECLPGFTGTRCMDRCPDRRWGLECRNKCSCEWNQTMRCRADNGQCLCHAGYRGETCRQFCDDGTYGQDCKHPCPACSRHVTGPCYKIDGRCPCSCGYRGHLCDNDCPLKNFGKNCEERCRCDAEHVCHHVNGACHPVNAGKFQIIIKEIYADFDPDVQRRKQLKLHLATLISKYHDKYEEFRHVSRRQAPSQSTRGYVNATLTTLSPAKRTVQPAGGHDLVARILDLSPGSISDGSDVVLVDLVMFDGNLLLNGSIVKDVISSLDEDDVSAILGSVYYSGNLYSETSDKESVYVQLITGIAGGLLSCVLLIFVGLMCRRRRRHLRKLKSEKKRQREAEKEMELKTRSFRHNGYRLAFDNPYYDVLAAMALDDDVEEDYINPLCDLDSLMSNQESEGTVSSATECSIQKGESLQSVSYC